MISDMHYKFQSLCACLHYKVVSSHNLLKLFIVTLIYEDDLQVCLLIRSKIFQDVVQEKPGCKLSQQAEEFTLPIYLKLVVNVMDSRYFRALFLMI